VHGPAAGLILDCGNVLTRPRHEAWFAAAAERLGAEALDRLRALIR
jgi:hypothetical protein